MLKMNLIFFPIYRDKWGQIGDMNKLSALNNMLWSIFKNFIQILLLI